MNNTIYSWQEKPLRHNLNHFSPNHQSLWKWIGLSLLMLAMSGCQAINVLLAKSEIEVQKQPEKPRGVLYAPPENECPISQVQEEKHSPVTPTESSESNNSASSMTPEELQNTVEQLKRDATSLYQEMIPDKFNQNAERAQKALVLINRIDELSSWLWSLPPSTVVQEQRKTLFKAITDAYSVHNISRIPSEVEQEIKDIRIKTLDLGAEIVKGIGNSSERQQQAQSMKQRLEQLWPLIACELSFMQQSITHKWWSADEIIQYVLADGQIEMPEQLSAYMEL